MMICGATVPIESVINWIFKNKSTDHHYRQYWLPNALLARKKTHISTQDTTKLKLQALISLQQSAPDLHN